MKNYRKILLFWMTIFMFIFTSIVIFSSFAYLEPSRNNLILIVGISFTGYLAAFLFADEYLKEKQKTRI